MRDTDWRPSPCPICGEMRIAAEKPACLNAGCGKKEAPGFDPYTNRIPHWLLTNDEKAALAATGGPWESLDPFSGTRTNTPSPAWLRDYIYRAVRRPLTVPQEGDVWIRTSPGSGKHWFPAQPNDPEAGSIIAEGYRLFREVKP